MDKSDKSKEEKQASDKDEAQEQDGKTDFEELFTSFSRFGDRESDGTTITLKNIDKWMKQAKLLGGKSKITNADTAITFSKIAKTNKRVDINDFLKILEQLAKDKNMDKQDLIDKLKTAGQPRLLNVTVPVTSGAAGANLERMTDTKLYTGSHKERFDEEGQGRGKEGREDVANTSGYVQGYKHKDTYDKKKKDSDKDDDDDEDDK